MAIRSLDTDRLLNNIEGYCTIYGISLRELARKANISGSTFTRLRHGHCISVGALYSLEAATNGFVDSSRYSVAP